MGSNNFWILVRLLIVDEKRVNFSYIMEYQEGSWLWKLICLWYEFLCKLINTSTPLCTVTMMDITTSSASFTMAHVYPNMYHKPNIWYTLAKISLFTIWKNHLYVAFKDKIFLWSYLMIKNNRQVYVQTKLIKVLQENCLGLPKEELKKTFCRVIQ